MSTAWGANAHRRGGPPSALSRRAPATIGAAFVMLGAGGCAVNDSGFVTRRYYECETAWIVELEALGFHLTSSALDAGLTVGHSRRTYFIPKRPEESERADRGAAIDVTALVAGRAGEERQPPPGGMARLGAPVAIDERATGIMLRTNEHAVGITLGVEQRTVLRLPADFEGVVAMRARRDGGPGSFHVRETMP
jgi:hypothetical protein